MESLAQRTGTSEPSNPLNLRGTGSRAGCCLPRPCFPGVTLHSPCLGSKHVAADGEQRLAIDLGFGEQGTLSRGTVESPSGFVLLALSSLGATLALLGCDDFSKMAGPQPR